MTVLEVAAVAFSGALAAPVLAALAGVGWRLAGAVFGAVTEFATPTQGTSNYFTTNIVLDYLVRHARRLGKSSTSYHIYSDYSGNFLAQEHTYLSSQVFFWKRAPIYYAIAEKQNPNMSPGNGNANYGSFRALRGTVDWDDLVRKATEFHAESRTSTSRQDFRVVRHFASNSTDKPLASGGPPSDLSGPADLNLGRFITDPPRTEEERRLLDTMSLGAGAQAVVDDVKFWLDHEDWYDRRGISWKRGHCLHGLPGSGKTSLVRAIAHDFGLPVHVFSMSGMTNHDFINAWNQAMSDAIRIVLLEDVDMVFRGREPVGDDGLTFDVVLNAIDGVEQAHGTLLFVTTNQPEHLDPALLRPGRIDTSTELAAMDDAGRRKIALRITNSAEAAEEIVEATRGQTPAVVENEAVKWALRDLWSRRAA